MHITIDILIVRSRILSMGYTERVEWAKAFDARVDANARDKTGHRLQNLLLKNERDQRNKRGLEILQRLGVREALEDVNRDLWQGEGKLSDRPEFYGGYVLGATFPTFSADRDFSTLHASVVSVTGITRLGVWLRNLDPDESPVVLIKDDGLTDDVDYPPDLVKLVLRHPYDRLGELLQFAASPAVQTSREFITEMKQPYDIDAAEVFNRNLIEHCERRVRNGCLPQQMRARAAEMLDLLPPFDLGNGHTRPSIPASEIRAWAAQLKREHAPNPPGVVRRLLNMVGNAPLFR